MANSKKLTSYTGSATTVSIPTSVDNVLVRDISTTAFTSAVTTVAVDSFADDIEGAPWGAENVLWLKEPTCSVAFEANGGTGSMATLTINSGLSYTIPQCTFVAPTDKTFEAWAIDSAEGTLITPGATTTFTADTSLYAVWATNAYTISFDANGGSGSMSSQSVTPGSSFTFPACTFSAPTTSEEFKAWTIGSTTGTEVQPGESLIFTSSTTLYAKWGVWDTNPMTSEEATAFGYTWTVGGN